MANEDGVWRTIGGRRVFIKKGQDLASAMKESGKFKSASKSGAKKDVTEEKKADSDREKLRNTEKEYEELSKKMQADDYYYKTEDDRKLKELRAKADIERVRQGIDTQEKYDKLMSEDSNKKEKSFDVRKYEVEVQHDNGKAKINVTASDEETAKKMVMNAERAPESAIVGVKDKGSILYKEDAKSERMKGVAEQDERIKKSYEDAKKIGMSNEDAVRTALQKEKSTNDLMNEKIRSRGKTEGTNKYKSTKHEGFGDYNDDYIPVYDNKIDYTGDFSRANLSKLSNEELTQALNTQSEEYHIASAEKLGDQRTRNGKMDKIFNTAKLQKYEQGSKLLSEELDKRNLPRYNIYDVKNKDMILVSSPTREMAERQLKEMYSTDKSLQKQYGWKELPKYEIQESKANAKQTENKMTNALKRQAYKNYMKQHPNSKMTFEEYKNM